MKNKLPDGLKLRGGVWWLIVSVNGTRIRKSLGIPKSQKKAAVQAVNEFWLEVARGNLGVNRPDPLLSTVFDNYIEFKRNEGSVTAWRLACIDMYLSRTKTNLGDFPVSRFKVNDFIYWLNSMKTKRTAKEINAVVQSAFRHAIQMKTIEKNPLENSVSIRHEKKTKDPLTQAEFIQFGNLAMNYSCGKLLLFLMKTGCRFNEAAKATWQKIDLNAGTFTLRAEDTKTRKARTIGLSTDLCIMLNRMKPEQAKPSDLVFLNQAGNAYSKDNVRRTVKWIGKKIDRPDITTHSLRHTYTTLIRDTGAVPIEAVQRELGHTSGHMTRHYDHDSPQRQRKLADKLPVFDIKPA